MNLQKSRDEKGKTSSTFSKCKPISVCVFKLNSNVFFRKSDLTTTFVFGFDTRCF